VKAYVVYVHQPILDISVIIVFVLSFLNLKFSESQRPELSGWHRLSASL
jgi:hypothetical protein